MDIEYQNNAYSNKTTAKGIDENKFYTPYTVHKKGFLGEFYRSYRGVSDFFKREMNNQSQKSLRVKAIKTGPYTKKYVVLGKDLIEFLNNGNIFVIK